MLMAVRKAILIAKYLLKNHATNPILKKLGRASFIAYILFVLLIVLPIALVGLSLGKARSSSYGGPVQELKKALIRLGLTKQLLIDSLSALLTVTVLMPFLKGRSFLVVMEEAEGELLLAQPIEMREYVLGRTAYEIGSSMIGYAFSLWLTPMIFEASGGNLAKSLLYPLVSLLSLLSITSLLDLATLIKVTLRRRERYLRLLAGIYLIIGVLHSASTLHPSPLLSLPLRPIASAMIYCVTRSDSYLKVVVSLAETTALFSASLLALLKLSDSLSPEDVKALRELMRGELSEVVRRGRVRILDDMHRAIMYQVVIADVLTKTHVQNLTLALILALGTGLLMGHVLPERLGLSIRSFLDFYPFIVSFITIELLTILASSVIARDLSALWIYRIYAPDLRPWAGALLLKCSIYLSEGLTLLSLFEATMEGDQLLLLTPLLNLPLTLLTSFLSLMLLTYLASRRRVIKESPIGMYMLEDLATLF